MTYRIAVLPEPSIQDKVFERSHREALERLGTVTYNEIDGIPTEQTMQDVIAGADLVLTSWGCESLTAAILDRAPQLQAVIHVAGTVKPIVTPELWARGIRVSSCNEPLAVGVAETALALTIASLKNMWQLLQTTRDGGWAFGRDRVREMYGVTIGVIGAGKAGLHYMRLLRQFTVQVVVYDPYLTPERAKELGVRKVGLEELLAASDVVSIHAPSLPETYRLINRERLQLMKDDAILINTARGALIDEEALADELGKGRLFACLDVTDPEPPMKDHLFRSLPNCIVLPHIAGAVHNGIKRLGQFAVEEAERFAAGLPLLGEVKEEQLGVLA